MVSPLPQNEPNCASRLHPCPTKDGNTTYFHRSTRPPSFPSDRRNAQTHTLSLWTKKRSALTNQTRRNCPCPLNNVAMPCFGSCSLCWLLLIDKSALSTLSYSQRTQPHPPQNTDFYNRHNTLFFICLFPFPPFSSMTRRPRSGDLGKRNHTCSCTAMVVFCPMLRLPS